VRFYTYIWLRLDGTPYYVGKGQGRRGFISGSHRLRRPISDDQIIVQEYECEEDSLFAECVLIAFYGRKDLGTGCLRNMTNGGEGVSGRIIPEWLRLRLIEVNTGRKASEETRHILRQSHLGQKVSPEARVKMSIARKGRSLSPEHCKKLSFYARNRSEEHKRRLAESCSKTRKGKPWSERRRAAQIARNDRSDEK